ncbi:proton-conducting transporter transmembrane domain-containing protein [Tautonia plasticadhaerens]|uniref:NAD(P)H-quinone oxidoreductase chain 4 1 n=1 Tax=Tautonia plasticadhaerens TaxID=2527974 RepID=A0A518H0U2_9BACT|nr:proton-conducting transporter membrane subunit [Tautonia plasticadhaerens]QDV34441.1 NAD(P)H-quinone oxidoreductase chain 4 1 [Tautonia plasticadhaerens]
MPELHLPWLGLCVLVPALGAIRVGLTKDPDSARRLGLVASGLALACAVAAWLDFGILGTSEARDGWAPLARLLPEDLLVLDALSAPLLPMSALICFLTNLATLRTKVREFSFARSLATEAVLLATLACKHPWGIVALLAAGTVPPFLELRARRRPTRVYAAHMAVFVALLCLGQALIADRGGAPGYSVLAVSLLTSAVLLRDGIVPVHCWMTDLFEHATFGTALLTVTPMVGAYGVTRLVLPVAPPWILQAISAASLFTALYAAGMALVQREARRFFCYLFLSHSSLVLVGLETATPVGLTGALSLWPSVALSLTGFGLALRCVESRVGRVSLADFHGLDAHVPLLAALFLLTGLAGIGFPGTAGFVGLELLVEGATRAMPLAGAGVVVVAALNGLAVMHAYFRIFTGRPREATIDLRIRLPERVAVLILTALILGGGLFPQPGVSSRYRAAVGLAEERAGRLLGTSTPPPRDPTAPAADRPGRRPRPSAGPHAAGAPVRPGRDGRRAGESPGRP